MTHPNLDKELEGLPEEQREQLKAIIQQVVDALEAGRWPKWRRSWVGYGSQRSGSSGRPYKGINQWWLWLIQALSGYRSFVWYTEERARKNGWTVRPGEFPTAIQSHVWSGLDSDWDFAPVLARGARVIEVYNADQLIGPEPAPELPKESSIGLARVHHLVTAVGAQVVRSRGDVSASFNRGIDRMQMPGMEAFPTVAAFSATMLHELVHWTGHRSRLGRLFGSFGDERYAFEELVAELGSAMLCSSLGVEDARAEDNQHVAYLSDWAAMLRKTPGVLLRALRLAARAHAFLKDLAPEVFDLDTDVEPRSDFPLPIEGAPIWSTRMRALDDGPCEVWSEAHDGGPGASSRRLPTSIVPSLVLPGEAAATLERFLAARAAYLDDAGPVPVLRLQGVRGSGALMLAAWLGGTPEDTPDLAVRGGRWPMARKTPGLTLHGVRPFDDRRWADGVLCDLTPVIRGVSNDLEDDGQQVLFDWLNNNIEWAVEHAIQCWFDGQEPAEPPLSHSVDVVVLDTWAEEASTPSRTAAVLVESLTEPLPCAVLLSGRGPAVVVGPAPVQALIRTPPGAVDFVIDCMALDIPGHTARWVAGLTDSRPAIALRHRLKGVDYPLAHPGTRYRKPFWTSKRHALGPQPLQSLDDTLPLTPLAAWSACALFEALLAEGREVPWLGVGLRRGVERALDRSRVGLVTAADVVVSCFDKPEPVGASGVDVDLDLRRMGEYSGGSVVWPQVTPGPVDQERGEHHHRAD